MDSCIYDDIVITVLSKGRKVLHFKVSKVHQILCIHKTEINVTNYSHKVHTVEINSHVSHSY